MSFEQNAMPKSDIYSNFLPLVNSKKVALLDYPRLVAQLCGLERRTARSGKDSIDHGPGAKDHVCNVACGVLVGLDLDRRQPLVRQSDMLVDAAALPIPAMAKYIVATLAVDKFGSAAVIYSAVGHEGLGPPLTILDFDASPISISVFPRIGARVRELSASVKARGSVVFVWPADLINHARSVGLVCADMPDDIDPEELLLSASNHVSAGSVKLCQDALEKSRTSTFGAALDLRAAENADDPLRAAALLTIALSLDVPQ